MSNCRHPFKKSLAPGSEEESQFFPNTSNSLSNYNITKQGLCKIEKLVLCNFRGVNGGSVVSSVMIEVPCDWLI